MLQHVGCTIVLKPHNDGGVVRSQDPSIVLLLYCSSLFISPNRDEKTSWAGTFHYVPGTRVSYWHGIKPLESHHTNRRHRNYSNRV